MATTMCEMDDDKKRVPLTRAELAQIAEILGTVKTTPEMKADFIERMYGLVLNGNYFDESTE